MKQFLRANGQDMNDPVQLESVLFNTGELLGIKTLDHVIIGNNKWFSFREND